VARGSRLARLAALGLLGVATLTGCSMPNNEFWRFGWPEGITEQSTAMRELWTGSVIAALIVGILVWGLIFWSVVRHRKKGDELPKQTAYNLPLEIVYTILPFVIIAGLFFYTVVVQNEVQERSENPDETIAVNAFKWNWQFEYPGTEGPDGAPVSTTGSSEEIPILVLPTDRTIRFEVQSADVIHSFWVPEFLFKLDVIPGNENGRDNVFEVTVQEEGAYVGRCAELCGTYHAFMNFEVRAVSGADYDAYLEARADGLTTYDALESIGQQGNAISTKPFDLVQAGD
jgi:cytochrome c oxidase subunit 2